MRAHYLVTVALVVAFTIALGLWLDHRHHRGHYRASQRRARSLKQARERKPDAL